MHFLLIIFYKQTASRAISKIFKFQNINNIVFKDKEFKKALIKLGHDKDNDQKISYDEAKKVSSLILEVTRIVSLDELTTFENLNYLI